MQNLTYFFGAGASAGTKEKPAIPILNVFNEALHDFFIWLTIKELRKNEIEVKSYEKTNDYYLNKLNNITLLEKEKNADGELKYSRNFINFLFHSKLILEDLNEHTTVDTLARKYFLLGSNGKSKLTTLKALLTLYFLHLQHNKKQFDMRYDSFISTLLNIGTHGQLELPNNVKIISWNYDLQFEMGLKKYQESNLGDIQEQFKIHPSKAHCNLSNGMESFGMVKLNGSAGLFIKPEEIYSNGTKIQAIVKDIDDIYSNEISTLELFDLFYSLTTRGNYSLSPFYRYSWENDNERHNKIPNLKKYLLDYAKEIMSISNYVVVIGYSFPPFNRKVDMELFNCLPENAIVYIQDTNPIRKKNFEDIFSSFEERNIKVEYIEDVSQFFIPPAYFEE